MGTQGVSQCFGCGVVSEGEEDTEDGNFYCFACWLIYHAAHYRPGARTERCTIVHSMSEAFRMYLRKCAA
jgi:hypothetical protein